MCLAYEIGDVIHSRSRRIRFGRERDTRAGSGTRDEAKRRRESRRKTVARGRKNGDFDDFRESKIVCLFVLEVLGDQKVFIVRVTK